MRPYFNNSLNVFPNAKIMFYFKISLKIEGYYGDPDENRTRVTAVKGRCLNRLTTGPLLKQKNKTGSDRWTRTIDTSGMNRML